MWGLILGPQDHDLRPRQMLNRLSHTGAPTLELVIVLKCAQHLSDVFELKSEEQD